MDRIETLTSLARNARPSTSFEESLSMAKLKVVGGTLPYLHKYTWWAGGNIVSQGEVGAGNRRWRYRYWNTTSNWKALLASQGYLNTLGYLDHSDEWNSSRCAEAVTYKRVTDPNYKFVFEPCPPIDPVLYSPQIEVLDTANQLSEAKFKALAKARNMKVNLAVAFAEGNKTLRMITGTAHTLGKAYGHFRRGSFGKAAKVLGIGRPPKAAAQNWLAYIYGWLPLISDVQGAAETLAETWEVPRSVRLTVRSKVERHYPFDVTVPGHVSGSVVRHKGRDIAVTRAGLYLEISNRGDQFAASLGFGGVSDLGVVLWELIPFSFVFDWFVKVGQYIESISALSGITVLDGWQSTQVQRVASMLPAKNSVWESDLPEVPYRQRRFNRQPWSGDSPTWPVFRALRGINAEKLVTVGALYQQLFRNDPPMGTFRPPWLYGHKGR